MTMSEIRRKYIAFFEKEAHQEVVPAPLVLENDPTTLFTSSGMQPLVPFLLGETHPQGKRLVDSQPCIRVQDIEEVGDNRHTTFFEMLGNWSLGDYFKEKQIPWVFEYLTQELKINPQKLFITVFRGREDIGIPRDTEAVAIWKEVFKGLDIEALDVDFSEKDGMGEGRIFYYDDRKNWWSRSGRPDQMPVGEPGGPCSEIFYDFGVELNLHEKSAFKDDVCHVNCDCGRFMEIGNSVFMSYVKKDDGFHPLAHKNIDFGGGLERVAAAVNNDPDMFKIDVLAAVVKSIEKLTGQKYSDPQFQAPMRVIADHVRAAVFLELYGVTPSNKGQGYIMRRLLRRAALKARTLIGELTDPAIFTAVIETIYVEYRDSYLEDRNVLPVEKLIADEVGKFIKTLEKGLREVAKIKEIDGKIAFDLYQTYGFPLELSIEIFQEKGQKIDAEQFKGAFEEHQNKSRTASAGVFKGGLMDHSAETTRLHTATHLLHAAMRNILGPHVQQKGSNITHERLRFDFTHPTKLTPEQIKAIEDQVNEQIDTDLPVSFSMMSLNEAKEAGALAFFDQKYGEQVKVYTVGDPAGDFYSKEVCGGPHVTRLSELGGHVKITREEASGSNVRRMYATIG